MQPHRPRPPDTRPSSRPVSPHVGGPGPGTTTRSWDQHRRHTYSSDPRFVRPTGTCPHDSAKEAPSATDVAAATAMVHAVSLEQGGLDDRQTGRSAPPISSDRAARLETNRQAARLLAGRTAAMMRVSGAGISGSGGGAGSSQPGDENATATVAYRPLAWARSSPRGGVAGAAGSGPCSLSDSLKGATTTSPAISLSAVRRGQSMSFDEGMDVPDGGAPSPPRLKLPSSPKEAGAGDSIIQRVHRGAATAPLPASERQHYTPSPPVRVSLRRRPSQGATAPGGVGGAHSRRNLLAVAMGADAAAATSADADQGAPDSGQRAHAGGVLPSRTAVSASVPGSSPEPVIQARATRNEAAGQSAASSGKAQTSDAATSNAGEAAEADDAETGDTPVLRPMRSQFDATGGAGNERAQQLPELAELALGAPALPSS